MKRLLLLLVPLLFTACGLSSQQQADYAAVQRSGVSSATYDKMLHDDPLGLTDIENLSRARVNDGIILRYLRDHDTIYTLNSGDVARLRKAGVSSSVIDYMLQTSRNYYDDGPDVHIGIGYDPFWYGPYYGPYYRGGYYHHHHHWR